MAFLVVAGFTIPVAVDSSRRPRPDEIGSLDRMANGGLNGHRRAKKRKLEFDLPVSTWAYVLEAYEGLLRGDGHVFGYGSGWGLYSYKGLGPSSSSGATQSNAGGKYAGKLTLAATTGTITYNPGLPSNRWTVMVWRYESSAWHHYVVRSDGTVWKDGSTPATSPTWLTVPGDGTATIANTAGSSQDYADLVLLPYCCASTWPALVYASARAWSQLPKLEVYGSALLGSSASSPVTMQGEVGDATYVPANTGSGRDVTAQRLSVTLREV